MTPYSSGLGPLSNASASGGPGLPTKFSNEATDNPLRYSSFPLSQETQGSGRSPSGYLIAQQWPLGDRPLPSSRSALQADTKRLTLKRVSYLTQSTSHSYSLSPFTKLNDAVVQLPVRRNYEYSSDRTTDSSSRLHKLGRAE